MKAVKPVKPRIHFGKIPTTGLILSLILCPLFILRPIIQVAITYLQGGTLYPMDTLVAGFALGSMMILTLMAISTGFSIRHYWQTSKRIRYITKKLVPYLNNRYGITVDMSSTAGAAHLLSDGMVKVQGRDDVLVFIGWPQIEKVALGEDIDLSEELYLAEQYGDKAQEIKPAGYKEGGPLATFSPIKTLTPLEETENGVKVLMFETLMDLPVGRTIINMVPPGSMELPGLTKSMKVDIEPDYTMNYSTDDFAKIVEAGVFNIRLGESACMMLEIGHGDKIYVLGKIIFADSYKSLDIQDLSDMMGSKNEVTYLNDLSDFKKLAQ